ncbi:hypothetical protein GOODEAATRI_033855, partial [Goodea atripinnis]
HRCSYLKILPWPPEGGHSHCWQTESPHLLLQSQLRTVNTQVKEAADSQLQVSHPPQLTCASPC